MASVVAGSWQGERKVQAGFLIALACVAAIGLAAYLALVRLTQDEAWVAHTDQVLGALDRLLGHSTEAETAERGYVLAGEASSVDAVHRAADATAGEYRDLRLLTADNAAQQRRLDQLGPLIGAHAAELTTVTELRASSGAESAQRELFSARAQTTRSALRGIVEDMRATETGLLSLRQHASAQQALITQAITLGGGALAFVFLALSWRAVRRELAGRQRAEQALRAANETLEGRVVERTAELTRANQALEASDARFRGFVNATSEAVYRMNADWSQMYHLQGRDFIADTNDPSRSWIEKYIHPDDQALVLETIRKAIRTRSTFELEHRVKRVDGTLGWTFSRAIPLLDHDGEITEWFGAASDVTARRQAQEKLRAQVIRLTLLDEITRAISERLDVQSIFQVVVRTIEEQFGAAFACICLRDETEGSLKVVSVGARSAALVSERSLPELVRLDLSPNGLLRCLQGQLLYESDVAESAEAFPEFFRQAQLRALVAAPLTADGKVLGILIAARRDPDTFTSQECEFLRQLGEHVALAVRQAQLRESLQAAYEDLRRTQQTTMQQERLRALGQMASGIAHDVNNALSPASLYAQFLIERDAALNEQARGYLKAIQTAIEDVGRTVTRIRMFARPRELELTLASINLNELAAQVATLTRARWRDMSHQRGIVIDLAQELEAELPPIMGAENEIRDALTNLILNAVDAMPKGGTLTLRTRASAAAEASGAGRRVTIEVADSGVGMSEAVRARCLEPFFTTKGERGTGLGLAMVYGMVQRHSAELDIESAPGIGTLIRLTFPAISAEQFSASDAATEPGRALRILLVDDDPLILQSLEEVLTADGHSVASADGGRAGIEAFQRARSEGGGFDVVITDLGMPNVDGRAVAQAVKSASGTTPVILLTGWGRRLRSDAQEPTPHVDRILSKPPRVAELRTALAQLTAAGA